MELGSLPFPVAGSMPCPTRLTFLAVLLSALAGCSTGTSPNPRSAINGGGPGSRLAVVTLNGPDSLAVFSGFNDMERGEPCQVLLAGDGTLRCLPLGVNGPTDGNVFADPTWAESSRLVRRRTPYAGANLAVMPDPANCPTRWHVRELGTQVTGNPPICTQANPGDPCVELPWQSVDRYLLAGEIAPASFVSFTERLGVPHDGLRARDLVAADGAWQQSGAWDEGRGLPCSWILDGMGAWRCVDSDRAGWYGLWSDAACSVPAVSYLRGDVGCAPTIAVGDSGQGCRGRSGIHEVGAVLPGVYQFPDPVSNPVCWAVESPSAFAAGPFWSRGVELSPATFPIGVEAPAGRGRLAAASVSLGTDPRPVGELIDRELEFRCTAGYMVNEDVLRCLPTEASLAMVVDNYFSDTLCWSRLAWSTGCDASVALFHDPSDTFDRYYRLGAPLPGTIYSFVGNDCLPSPGPWPEGVPHLLGADIPSSAFAQLTYELRIP